MARLLEVPYEVLVFHLYRAKKESCYTSFAVPKKSGGTRIIRAPVTALKLLQRKLNRVLQAVYVPKASVHGFVLARSVVTNADRHIEKRFVLNLDLEDFFPSINFGRARGMFLAKPYSLPGSVATVLAQICCFENELPQGAPTSPIVSNMVCARMDTQLQRLARQHRCTYTRYADDMTISTSLNSFPPELARLDDASSPAAVILGNALKAAIDRNGFKINAKKVRLQLPQDRHTVTGLTANEFPNVQRGYLNQLRAMLHAWRKFGYEAAQRDFSEKHDTKHRGPFKSPVRFRQVISGRLAYLEMVRGSRNSIFLRYAGQFARLDEDYAKTFELKLQKQRDPNDPTNAVFVLDALNCQATGFPLEEVGLVTCAHAWYADTIVFDVHNPSRKYAPKLLATHAHLDLAVLEIQPDNPITIRRGNSDRVNQGDPCVLLGFPNFAPGHQSVSVYEGKIVSVRTTSGIKRFMVDIPILAGSSGGPVLNSKNEVIGVAFMGVDRLDKDPEGEYGVTPINYIELLVATT